jgi:hypothetical protein
MPTGDLTACADLRVVQCVLRRNPYSGAGQAQDGDGGSGRPIRTRRRRADPAGGRIAFAPIDIPPFHEDRYCVGRAVNSSPICCRAFPYPRKLKSLAALCRKASQNRTRSRDQRARIHVSSLEFNPSPNFHERIRRYSEPIDCMGGVSGHKGK